MLPIKCHDSYFDGDFLLDLCFDEYKYLFDGIVLRLGDVPYLKNSITGEIFFPPQTVLLMNLWFNKAKIENKTNIKMKTMDKRRLQNAPIARNANIDFIYSPIEHFFIPGLARRGEGIWNSDGYLTPVYFNKDVLARYNLVYKVTSYTSSYGYITGEDLSFPYGVNRKGHVIMWLGDLIKLPDKEQKYFKLENINPDFDIHSDFYNNQILGEWING